MQRHTYNLAAADTAVPGVYDPRTDKGKERVSGSSTSHCETTDPVEDWVDPGFTTELAKVKILWSPIPEPARPDIEGFDPVPSNVDITLEGFRSYDGPQIQILTRGQLPDNLPEGTWLPPEEALDKVPDFLGVGKPAGKTEGWKWQSKDTSKVIRIMKGNPAADYPTQQVDYVKITWEGKQLGVDGNPLPTGVTGKDPRAHIPVAEWLKWAQKGK